MKLRKGIKIRKKKKKKKLTNLDLDNNQVKKCQTITNFDNRSAQKQEKTNEKPIARRKKMSHNTSVRTAYGKLK